MTPVKKLLRFMRPLPCLLLLAGCAAVTPKPQLPPHADSTRIDALQRDILALDAGIDHAEAGRAARIAVRYSRELARLYEVENSPIVHNLLVNLGIKQRGLCKHWTADLLKRLQQERFRSLDLHWAVGNFDTAFTLEHSTVVVSAHGERIARGLVLDPWRHSGELYWAPTLQDPGYDWKPYRDVIALKREYEADLKNRRMLR